MDSNHTPEFVTLRNDLLFHMVFTKNAEALKDLISTMLNIPAADIQRVEVLNPMQYSDVIDTKMTILDLKVHLNDEKFVLVEMQVRRFDSWTNRTVAYASRQLADQVHDNFSYGLLQPVIQISIMDYTLFPDHKRFFTRYIPRDEEGYPYTDKLQFYVMDLTAIAEATKEDKKQGLVEWAKAFKAESWEEVREIDNSGVKEAAKTMELIMANPTERDLIRMRRDAQIDWNTMVSSEVRNGQISMLASLVRDGLLTVHLAAQRVKMTDEEFVKETGLKL